MIIFLQSFVDHIWLLFQNFPMGFIELFPTLVASGGLCGVTTSLQIQIQKIC